LRPPWHLSRRKERHAHGRDRPSEAAWQAANDATVGALAVALELREDESGGHTERVTELGLRLAREVAPDLALDPALRLGFLFHDIGKVGVPDSILLKRGQLSDRERATLEHHPILGEHLISSAPALAGAARDVILHHHERWDGSGYPWGLRGEAIPLAARIFALADAFDAMTNDRPYRRALTLEEAIAQIIDGGGTHFDPELVSPFVVIVGSRYRARPDLGKATSPRHVPTGRLDARDDVDWRGRTEETSVEVAR